MQKPIITFLKFPMVLVALCFIFSCKKEHLEPVTLPGNPEPLVYITANLDNDSVYFAGGVMDYAGSTSVLDTINYRTFNFILKNKQLPTQSFFKISINNYINGFGDPQTDLDSSVYPGNRSYMYPGVIFIPLYVTIRWTNAAGVEFKSAATVPNVFSITATEDIIFESKSYKKAIIQFECYLKDNAGNTIHLTNGNATILFSVN